MSWRPGQHGEPRRLARFRHQVRDRIPPGRIVRGRLVRGRGRVVAVHLDEHDVCRVDLVLHDVEAHDTRLLHGRPGVGEGGGDELVDPVGPDPYLNMDHQHAPHPATSGSVASCGWTDRPGACSRSATCTWHTRRTGSSSPGCGRSPTTTGSSSPATWP